MGIDDHPTYKPLKIYIFLDKQYEIIFLYKYSKKPKLSIMDMIIYIGCNRPTVIYWIKKYYQNSNLNN